MTRRDEPARLAAVVFGAGEEVDAAMAGAVATLRQEGLRVGGLLQRFGPVAAPCRRAMLLDVLETGACIRLDAPRGPEAQACTLDGDALARAAMALRDAARQRPDLLVVSRFGKQEASGGGLRAEIAEAVLAGVVVLVAVRASLLADWEAFLGGAAVVLPPAADAIAAWARPPARPAAPVAARHGAVAGGP